MVRNIDLLARVSGLLMMILNSVYLAEIAVVAEDYNIYEGYLAMIAVEFYIANNLVVDMKMFPVCTLIGRLYMVVRFLFSLPVFPIVLLPGFLAPSIVQVFTSINQNMHSKKHFLIKYSQNTTIKKLVKVLETFPEKIVVTKTDKDNGIKFVFTNDEEIMKMESNQGYFRQASVTIL
jgi:hypothetical protein